MHLALPDLAQEVDRLLIQIPRGFVSTYGSLATRLGDLKAARWVAEYLLEHPHSAHCLCHRVILKTGEPGQFISGSSAEKQHKLETEGVPFLEGRVDLSRFEFHDFLPKENPGSARLLPLQCLQQFQAEIAARFQEEFVVSEPETIGAVDVAYSSEGVAAAAFVVVEARTNRLLHSQTLRLPVQFPYITGYLAFRELNPILELLQSQPELPAVLFVDGNGRLHPRRAGIATTLGVLLNHPTVGVGKKLLCGKVNLEGLRKGESRPIRENDETIGAAVRGDDRFHPVFLSPGHRCDLASAIRWTQQQFCGHRLPESVFHADRLSKLAARS